MYLKSQAIIIFFSLNYSFNQNNLMKNKMKVFGLSLGMMAMSFTFFVGNPSSAKANDPGPCYMHMARCNGGTMSLDNCRSEHTAESCRGASCSTC